MPKTSIEYDKNYNQFKENITNYINHFSSDKTDICAWENRRKELHNKIFEKAGIERYSDVGREFEERIDKFCEPFISKKDTLVVVLKNFSHSKTQQELNANALKLKIELEKIRRRDLLGFREFKKSDKNECRICGKELSEGVARINDHLATVLGFTEINQPICFDCSKTNPDKYNIAFKKQFWNK